MMINENNWLLKARELYNLQQNRRALEKKEAELSQELKQLSNFQSAAFGGLKYYVEERMGSVDYAIIPELKTIDLSLYRKPSVQVWKLAIESI